MNEVNAHNSSVAQLFLNMFASLCMSASNINFEFRKLYLKSQSLKRKTTFNLSFLPKVFFFIQWDQFSIRGWKWKGREGLQMRFHAAGVADWLLLGRGSWLVSLHTHSNFEIKIQFKEHSRIVYNEVHFMLFCKASLRFHRLTSIERNFSSQRAQRWISVEKQ